MAENKTVVVLYGKLSENPKPDELDVLEEISIVKKGLISLAYEPIELEFDLNLEKVKDKLNEIHPYFVFNLVEMIENRGELHYIAPALLEYLNIPYSGASSEYLVLTTNKALAKQILKTHDINTAEWFSLNEIDRLDVNKKYILKPLKEDGSLGIDEDSVFNKVDERIIEKIKNLNPSNFFIEEFIEGREFNISLLGGKDFPEVLPLAEIKFNNYPVEKPKIMGYTAKWDEHSFEYKNTNRTFDIDKIYMGFEEDLKNLCIKCWNAFNSKGYIRIDIRVSANNIPFIIEINGNPCISSSGGFYAAAKKAGYSFKAVLERIIADAFKR